MVGHDAVALGICVHTVILSGCVAVNGHAKSDRLPVSRWTEHKVQVTCMKVKDDLSARRFKHRDLLVIDPSA
jgi:hypothetical protein